MMEWCVAKTGFEMFDALHAYGLALLLASAGGMPIEVRDNGLVYCVSSRWKLFLAPSLSVFDVLFALPSSQELLESSPHQWQDALSRATLDGLLTVLFTKGERTLSVSDLQRKRRFDRDAVRKALGKGTKAVQEWKEYVSHTSAGASDWLTDVLRDYAGSSPTTPLPRPVRKGKDLTAVLTLDPSLGYSTRRPTSDGGVHRKINIALHGARYATLLAYLGATRFLRGQRVAGSQVNLYVPLASSIIIDARTTLPTLWAIDCAAHHALVLYLLSLLDTCGVRVKGWNEGMSRDCQAHPYSGAWWKIQRCPTPMWEGLAYQTLQTQGAQQSLCLDWGSLESRWMTEVAHRSGGNLTRFWRQWLDGRGTTSVDERESLAACLLSHRSQAWIEHLRDVARYAYTDKHQHIRLYSVKEVQQMTNTSLTPLSVILERKEGTLRFGRALRQLGRYNPSILRDLLERLETVRSLDQLVLALHRAMQECLLAKANYPFIRLPSNRDLALLITDAEQYGVPLLASLLMILSALRFTYRDIDTYEVHTLISVLLALATQMPPPDDSSILSQDGDSSSMPLEITSVSFDEGESYL